MLDLAGLTVTDSLVDVGGGASRLADALLDRGHQDLTVLDISASGIDQARTRLSLRSEQVRWLITDLMRWNRVGNTGPGTDASLRLPVRLHFVAEPDGEGGELVPCLGGYRVGLGGAQVGCDGPQHRRLVTPAALAECIELLGDEAA
jgi:hypothetical protein